MQINNAIHAYEWLNNTKKKKKNWELKRQILINIATKEYSEKELAEKFDHRKKSGRNVGILDQSKVHKELNFLKEIGFVQFTRKIVTEDKGKPKKIWGLTDKGIYNTMQILEPKEFWKLIFHIFDKSVQHGSVRTDVKKLIERYEVDKLNISREIVIPVSFLRKLNEMKHKDISEENFYSNSYYTLEYIGLQGKIKINSIRKEFLEIRYQKDSHSTTLFSELEDQHLIHKEFIKHNEYVQLTQFGLLVLIFFEERKLLESLEKTKHKEKHIEKEFELKIEKIISKNELLIPILFKNWKMIKKILSTRSAISIITQIFFKSDLDSLIPDYREEELSILNALDAIQSTTQNRRKREFSLARQTCKEWQEKRSSKIPIFEENAFGHIQYEIIDFLEIPKLMFEKNLRKINPELKDEINKISQIRKPLKELVKIDKTTLTTDLFSIKFGELFQHSLEFKALANRITLYFLVIFRAWHQDKFNDLLELDKKREILAWFQNQIKELMDFNESQNLILKRDRGFFEGSAIKFSDKIKSGQSYILLQKLSEATYLAKYDMKKLGIYNKTKELEKF